MNRPPVDVVMMAIADSLAFRGMCNRLKVAAVVVFDKRIITSGVNGPNTWDCDELKCDVTKSCQHAVHAEENAILFAEKRGIDLEGSTLYCTHAPCRNCAELIVNAKITRVVYSEPYRADAIEYLEANNILVEQFELLLKHVKAA